MGMKKRKIKKNDKQNWTESNLDNFRYFVGADFVDQLQESFDVLGITQRSFAKSLKVSEGRISQVFNDPGNLTLDTMIKWSRAAGLKAGVVLYNDKDNKNLQGPLSGSIFVECWKILGAPTEWPNINAGQSVQVEYTNTPTMTLISEASSESLPASVRSFSMRLREILPKQEWSSSVPDNCKNVLLPEFCLG